MRRFSEQDPAHLRVAQAPKRATRCGAVLLRLRAPQHLPRQTPLRTSTPAHRLLRFMLVCVGDVTEQGAGER